MTYEEQFEKWFEEKSFNFDETVKKAMYEAFDKGADAGWEAHADAVWASECSC